MILYIICYISCLTLYNLHVLDHKLLKTGQEPNTLSSEDKDIIIILIILIINTCIIILASKTLNAAVSSSVFLIYLDKLHQNKLYSSFNKNFIYKSSNN